MPTSLRKLPRNVQSELTDDSHQVVSEWGGMLRGRGGKCQAVKSQARGHGGAIMVVAAQGLA